MIANFIIKDVHIKKNLSGQSAVNMLVLVSLYI